VAQAIDPTTRTRMFRAEFEISIGTPRSMRSRSSVGISPPSSRDDSSPFSTPT
jgi:hypothetical protein